MWKLKKKKKKQKKEKGSNNNTVYFFQDMTSTSNRHTTPGILTEAAKSKYQHPAVMLIGLDNGDYFIANIIIPILDIYLGVISVAK